ncbi:MAG: PorP/SprF family type IX secretion system membrane protein, partial [Bacteroidia bacterium]|nr:PorP/SprF family type IX secretion system membrane protein [Bacteroidia bacterium]
MRFALVVISLFFFTQCYSQQENQLTQFAYNKSIFNPAFTPFGKSTDISMVYRQQWAGIEGAPSDQIINADIPIIPKNIGFGFQMQRSTIGIQEKLDAIIKYSYKIKFEKIAIGFGLQGSARRFLNDFTDQRLLAIDGFEMDPSIE